MNDLLNIFLWFVQVVLGIKLITVSFTHGLRQSLPTMQAAKLKLSAAAKPVLYFVAVATFIGTLGLILPGVLGLAAWVTPVTAATMAVMLLMSIFLHVKSRDNPKIFVSIVLFVFAVLVAYGRWVLVPL